MAYPDVDRATSHTSAGADRLGSSQFRHEPMVLGAEVGRLVCPGIQLT
jgi:hypothetical protein